jgi:hypothetical protein
VLRIPSSAAAICTALALAGCGIAEQSPDLFLLQRTGQGQTMTLLVKDDGTVVCDGHQVKPLSDPQLLQARDLASALDKDAKAGLRIAPAAESVYRYSVKLPDGTISFADTADAGHKELAQAQLFTAQVVGNQCPTGSGA